MGERTIVISDIHMSDPAKSYSWFTEKYPQYLSSFLHKLASASSSSVKELVLLGDLFDLWLYPVNATPLSVSQIIDKNSSVINELRKCVENIASVYYILGNHDEGVTPRDLEALNCGQKKIQIVSPDFYSQKNAKKRRLEHGHAVDMFNAPDISGNSIGGYPLGFFITRLIASAANQTKAWRKLRSKLKNPEPGTIHPKLNLQEFMGLPNHSFFIATLIDVLQKEASLKDDTKISFSDPNLNNKYTIGDIKNHYENLFRNWLAKEKIHFLDSMLVMVRSNGLDWYAKNLLKRGFKPVILGHTHHFVDNKAGYDNDGCWCVPSKNSHEDVIPRYIIIDKDDKVTVKPWTEFGV